MNITVQDVISKLAEPVGPIERTVDKILFGHSDMEVRGIAVSFTASYEALKKAAELGLNLFLTHEGMFYSHHNDETSWQENSPIYKAKMKLIQSQKMTVYRFHDYPHRYVPDRITSGLIHALGIRGEVQHLQAASLVQMEDDMSVRQVAEWIKGKLQISHVRLIGDPDMVCRRIGLAVGYRGGSQHLIPLYENEHLDLIIAGEGPEWETPEYIRDVLTLGGGKALLMLGHAASEEPGMSRIADRIRDLYPHIPVYFIPASPLIQVI